MHRTSHDIMRNLLNRNRDRMIGNNLLDVGSADFEEDGNYRRQCLKMKFRYTGFDIRKGPNVDVIVPEIGDWYDGHKASISTQFDLAISGQCLEHVRQPWIWIKQVVSVIKPEGMFVCIAPNTWRYHPHPLDCWRVWPEGMTALFEYAGLTVLESAMIGVDTFGVGIKPK